MLIWPRLLFRATWFLENLSFSVCVCVFFLDTKGRNKEMYVKQCGFLFFFFLILFIDLSVLQYLNFLYLT